MTCSWFIVKLSLTTGLSSWNDSKGQCRSRNKVLQDQCFDISRPSCTCGSLRQGNVDSSTWDLINIPNTELTIACPQHDTPVSTSARLWSARLPACSCFLHRLVNLFRHLNLAILTCSSWHAPSVCIFCVPLLKSSFAHSSCPVAM